MYSKSTYLSLLLFFCTALFPAPFFAQNPCDTILVVAQATATNLSCSNPTTTLTGALDPSVLSYQWSGPGGFSSDKRVALHIAPGIYTLTATGLYGCTATISVTVTDGCNGLAGTGFALVPPACMPPYDAVIPADDCANACVMPYLPDTVVYNTAGYTASQVSNSCGTVENDQYFGFVAGRTGGTITATPKNCVHGNGIELAVYGGQCPNLNALACSAGAAGNGDVPISITLSGLNVGQVYYLAVDGYNGDLCEFTFKDTAGICTGTPSPPSSPAMTGPSMVCPDATATYHAINLGAYASAFLWSAPGDASINGGGNTAFFIKPQQGDVVTIHFGQQSGFVCARPIYYFQPPGAVTCLYVNNMEIPPTILDPAMVCMEAFPYTLPWGDVAPVPGHYEGTLKSWLNCDSVVKQEVIAIPSPIKNLGIITICDGDCFQAGGEFFCQAGQYSTVVTSYQGCDSTIVFTLKILDPIAQILGGGVLNCIQQVIFLNSVPSPGIKTWTYGNGQIVGNGNTLAVTQPGMYTLTVSFGICSTTSSIVIPQDFSSPGIFAQGGNLSCASPTIPISATTTSFPAVFHWSGPNGFTASSAQVSVNIPGNYVVTVTSMQNGCTASASVTVTSSIQNTLVATAIGGEISCTNPSVILQGSASDPLASFNWSGPNGFTGSGAQVTAMEPGAYTLTATDVNGCSAINTTQVTSGQSPPIATASGGVITCSSPGVFLEANSSDPSASFNWSGPNGFTGSGMQVPAFEPGDYTLVATTAGGCSTTSTTQVTSDLAPPMVTSSGGSITCSSPGVLLQANAADPSVIFNWTGPNGFTASGATVSTDQAGDYTLVATTANGCTATSTTQVLVNQTPPTVSASGGTLTCTSAAIPLTGIVSDPLADIVWTGPGGFSSTAPNPTVDQEGIYILTATAPNGCQASVSATVVSNQQAPALSLSADTVGCIPGNSTHVYATASSDWIYSWTGPDGFIADEDSPIVTAPGLYAVTVVNSINGCSAVSEIVVSGSLDLPNLSAVQIAPACGDSVLYLDAGSTVPGVQYFWTGPGLFSATTEDLAVTEPGWYVINAATANGCMASISILVVPAPSAPQVLIEGGILTCFEPEIQLQTSSDMPVVEYNWSGPAGFTSSEANPSVNTPGTYSLLLMSTNGCTTEMTYELTGDLEIPQISVIGGIITCDEPVVTISASSGTPGVVFNWLGGNFPSNQASVDVDEAGEYTVMATAPNGCTATAIVSVPDSCLVIIATDQPGDTHPLFRIYPNASTGIAFAEVLYSTGFEVLQVHSVDGRLILQTDFSTPQTIQKIDLSHLPSGVYIVSMRTGTVWRTEKLVLAK